VGEPSLSNLIARCREGDETAWRTLLDRFDALILSIPRRYGLDDEGCDEVYGEVCYKLVSSLDSIREPDALPKWLILTSTRTTWRVARRQTRMELPGDDLPEPTDDDPPEQFVLRLEREQIVREGLAALSERCRAILDALYFAPEPGDYDAISERLGIPRGSIGPTRARCLERMRRLVEPRLTGHLDEEGEEA